MAAASTPLHAKLSQSVSSAMPDLGASSMTAISTPQEPHPAGDVKHNRLIQVIRLFAVLTWFNCCSMVLFVTQCFGLPLYYLGYTDYWHSYMVGTKQGFGLVITSVTHWFSPTLIRVSGDASVRGQLKVTEDGRLETVFPQRLVMITNHQLYSDWLYLWWVAYTNKMHGHIYFVLKKSLKNLPVGGPAMVMFDFIFLARQWAQDKMAIKKGIERMKLRDGEIPKNDEQPDPMWLMVYPEGTNLSANTRRKSAAWSAKSGIPDFEHVLLPRSTGLQYCLQELGATVEWVYDVTVAYEGIPRDGYGQDLFTIPSSYLQGRPPKSVNMYWRRFPVSSIPVADIKAFEAWILQRWQEKEDLLEGYLQTGRFPADEGVGYAHPAAPGADEKNSRDEKAMTATPQGAGFIETEVRLGNWYEIADIFIVLASIAMAVNFIEKYWHAAYSACAALFQQYGAIFMAAF